MPDSERVVDEKPILVLACGALAREVKAVTRLNGWDHVVLTCLPADLHNTPDRIPEAVRQKIRTAKDAGSFSDILVLYGDCGTGGLLDKVLEEEGVERIGGDHCYAFYTGLDDFQALHDAEPGTFYLTDYLVRFFDRLVIQGLGLDRHPELMEMYFGNYTRVVYLAQEEDAELEAQARQAADTLGLAYERVMTGLGGLDAFLSSRVTTGVPQWHS